MGFIVGMWKNQIINIDTVTDIFIGNENTIKVNFSNGKGCQIAKYSNSEDAKKAIEIISQKISVYPLVNVPDEKEIKCYIMNSTTDTDKRNFDDGSKKKRTGGS